MTRKPIWCSVYISMFPLHPVDYWMMIWNIFRNNIEELKKKKYQNFIEFTQIS